MFSWSRGVVLLRPVGARLGHRIRGRAPTEARTLEQRLAELNKKDPFYSATYDIGLPRERPSRSKELSERLAYVRERRKDPSLERLARQRELLVDLESVEREWLANNGPLQIRRVAQHYSIFEHLYGEGYFVPRVHLDVLYPNPQDPDSYHRVYYGNHLKPTDASLAPEVAFAAEDDSLWTLALTNLDGHLYEPGKEYVHWCVANVPGNRVRDGETLVEYLQPFPPKGTGYHRFAFVLYKQEKRVEYDMKRVTKDSPLEDRTFVTREWYAKYQDVITPAGLAFFQSDWDANLTEFYHNVLNMKEPVYEYDFPAPYVRPQEWFPLRRSFNAYMDRYRDPRVVHKEYLLRKLKTEHPFKRPETPLKYPNAHFLPKRMPSWLQLKEKHTRLGWGHISDV